MPVGRRAELDRLADLLATDVPVVVIGEAGVGKTTVLRAAAAASSRTVLEGGALSTLSWLDYLALERALGRAMVDGDTVAVAADVESAVGDAVLLLDDLHWAGAATIEVAAALAKRVAVLAGIRSGDPGADRALERLVAAGFTRIDLAGLSPAESAALVAELRPELADAGRARLVARTGGNPLLLRELAVTGEPSASLRLAIAARLRLLDAGARDAFDLLALSGRPVRADALGEPGVKGLVEADLAVVSGDRVEVRHALLAELAVEQIEPDRRRSLHARIARAVDDIGEAARHYQLAGEPDRAFAAAMTAAEHSPRPAERASHLAVAAACANGPEADALRLRAARALEAVNDWAAMVAILDLLDPANVEAQATACLLRARGAWSGGDIEGLHTALAAGLELAGGTGSRTEVQLRIEQTRIPVFVDYDAGAGLQMAREGLRLAHETGVDIARAHYLLGTALTVFDQPDWVEHFGQAIAIARGGGDTVTEFLAAANLISAHEMSGDQVVGRALAREYAARSRDLGLGEWEHLYRVALVGLDFHAGRYIEAISAAEELLVLRLDARAVGQLVETHCVCLVDIGRIDEALRRLDASGDLLIDDFRGRMETLWVRLEAAFWGGRAVDAIALADEYMREHDDDANALFGAVTRAWASFDAGIDPGAGVAAQLRPILRPIPVEIDGVRALYAGDHERAARLLIEAADLWAPHHRRGELRSLWGAGEATRRGGDLARAVALLEGVEVRTREHGMLPLLARIHRSLRAAGQRRSAPRTRSAGGTLTGRQREVLQLVERGLTNAQIASRLGVSRHTVVTQLASASAKLGATSRAQAASMAAAIRDAS